MIDWIKTTQELNLTKDNIINSKQVYVICEKCEINRLQYYNVAGRKPTHICNSCSHCQEITYPEINNQKTKEIGTLKIASKTYVIATCNQCKEEQKVIFSQSRFKDGYICGSCKLKNKWQKGEYKPPPPTEQTPERKQKQSKIAKELWTRPEYRKALSESTKENKEKCSKRSKTNWENPDYRERVIKKQKENWDNPERKKQILSYMEDPEYKRRMSETITELWKDPEYIEKVLSSYDDERIQQMSQIGKDCWNNQEYRDIKHALYETEEYKAKMSQMNKDRWADPVYRQKLMEIFSADKFKMIMSKIGIKLWQNQEFRQKMINARLNQPIISSQHILLCNILNTLNIKYSIDKCIGWYQYDIVIEDFNLIIEVNGDYWHNLPEVITRDRAKSTYLRRYYQKYEFKYLWEHEFENINEVIKILNHWLKIKEIEQTDLNIDMLKTGAIDCSKTDIFIGKYGYANRFKETDIIIGYFIKNELIAISIGRPFNKILQIIDITMNYKYQSDKLFKFIINSIKQLNYESVTFFTNKNLDKYNYKILNKIKDVWFMNNDFVMTKEKLTERAKANNMTEEQYCKEYNHTKIIGNEMLIYDLLS